MKTAIRKIKSIGKSVVAGDIKEGDFVRVTNIKAATTHPNQAKLLKAAIKEGNGKVLVITMDDKYAEVAANDIRALMGTVRVPLKYLVKVK